MHPRVTRIRFAYMLGGNDLRETDN